LEVPGRDRYDALLRHLQAGRELPIQPRGSRFRPKLDVHRVGPRLLALALVVAALWIVAIVVTDRLKADHVDTWDGPDATVQSGLRLEGCDLPGFLEDSVFPAWIRYQGHIYRWADLSAPISSGTIPRLYTPSGYSLGDKVLYLITAADPALTPERIIVRNGESDAAAVFLLVPACT
jgi:hypothetical protein